MQLMQVFFIAFLIKNLVSSTFWPLLIEIVTINDICLALLTF